ncbi:MAG: hypothetical protein IPH12_06270 [Saprospirales bacterium]|nr:hypothetical protein [Saprospirales bacterium]
MLFGGVGHEPALEAVGGFELGFQGFRFGFGFRQGLPAGLKAGDVEKDGVVLARAGGGLGRGGGGGQGEEQEQGAGAAHGKWF